MKSRVRQTVYIGSPNTDAFYHLVGSVGVDGLFLYFLSLRVFLAVYFAVNKITSFVHSDKLVLCGGNEFQWGHWGYEISPNLQVFIDFNTAFCADYQMLPAFLYINDTLRSVRLEHEKRLQRVQANKDYIIVDPESNPILISFRTQGCYFSIKNFHIYLIKIVCMNSRELIFFCNEQVSSYLNPQDTVIWIILKTFDRMQDQLFVIDRNTLVMQKKQDVLLLLIFISVGALLRNCQGHRKVHLLLEEMLFNVCHLLAYFEDFSIDFDYLLNRVIALNFYLLLVFHDILFHTELRKALKNSLFFCTLKNELELLGYFIQSLSEGHFLKGICYLCDLSLKLEAIVGGYLRDRSNGVQNSNKSFINFLVSLLFCFVEGFFHLVFEIFKVGTNLCCHRVLDLFNPFEHTFLFGRVNLRIRVFFHI